MSQACAPTSIPASFQAPDVVLAPNLRLVREEGSAFIKFSAMDAIEEGSELLWTLGARQAPQASQSALPALLGMRCHVVYVWASAEELSTDDQSACRGGDADQSACRGGDAKEDPRRAGCGRQLKRRLDARLV